MTADRASLPRQSATPFVSIAANERWRAGETIPSQAVPGCHGVITTALQASDDPMLAPNWLPWRVGRKVGRTIYAQLGVEPSDDDVLIGTMDTADIAREAVNAHNSLLGRAQEARDGS